MPGRISEDDYELSDEGVLLTGLGDGRFRWTVRDPALEPIDRVFLPTLGESFSVGKQKIKFFPPPPPEVGVAREQAWELERWLRCAKDTLGFLRRASQETFEPGRDVFLSFADTFGERLEDQRKAAFAACEKTPTRPPAIELIESVTKLLAKLRRSANRGPSGTGTAHWDSRVERLSRKTEADLNRLQIVLSEVEDSIKSICEPLYTTKYAPPNRDPLLHVDEGARSVFWKGQPLDINKHADFHRLKRLYDDRGELVPFVDLLRTVKSPNVITDAVSAEKAAPPEVKDAIAHIRAAFRKAGCTMKIKSVRGEGYILEPAE